MNDGRPWLITDRRTKAAMIRVCVILPYSGEDACTSIINKAQENINTILKDNIRSILDALKPKMKANGIVIYNGYAPFFNAANEDCGDSSKQVWAFPQYWSWRYWLSRGLTLTIDRRQKFNTLVGNINGAIKDVVKEFQVDGAKKYDIEFSDWSGWPAEVDGEMCSPSSDGHYPDPNQPELQFFKPNTYVQKWTERDGLKKRDAAEEDVEAHLDEARERFKRELNLNLYDSLLYKSPDPRAAALHKLDSRAPSPPNCPGDGSFDPTLGLGLPDTFGRIFHPNEKGHETIAAFALQNLAYVRNFQLGKGAAVCEVPQDDFVCWRQVERRKAFVSWARLDVNYRDFCNSVTVPGNTVNWRFAKTYHPGTPEEVEFVLQLSKGAATYDKAACLESLDRVINSCDGNDPENPMNWKFGGKWVRGGYSWEIHPKKDRELHKRPDGSCQGWYKWALSAYTIYGKGWAGWDWGQETLLPNARSCVANSLTRWEFGYFDNPAEHDGWEWWSTFNTMIGVSGRCFDNLKVVGAAGGYTHRWEDNFADERYENYGCAGSWGS